MTEYCVVFENPDDLDAPAAIMSPTPEFMQMAKAGDLPEIWVYWRLQDKEQQAIHEGRHHEFQHDPNDLELQFTAPRTGPLTEEEAMEYLCMKDLPRNVWAKQHNRPMFKIVPKKDVPSDRTFRNAWRLNNEPN